MRQYLSLGFAVLMLLCCMGCGNNRVITPTHPAMQEVIQPSASTATEATLRNTEPNTVPVTEPEAIPSTEPEIVLHSGLREDGSFSEGTLFIGDSLTYNFTGSYLPENGLMGEAKYIAQCGSQITAFFSSIRLQSNGTPATRCSPEFEDMEFDEAAAFMGCDATAIYLMWGTNFTPDATKDNYIQIVDFLLENCPNATIHLQTIPYGQVPFGTVNKRILGAYAHYQQIGEPRVFLIDTHTAIGDHTKDGVHLNITGNANWYRAIVDHAIANSLSQ